MFREPVKRTGVIVLNIDGERDRRTGAAAHRGGEQKQNRQARFHRAPWIFGFWVSFPRSWTWEMQVS
jgi:hypothetical protein